MTDQQLVDWLAERGASFKQMADEFTADGHAYSEVTALAKINADNLTAAAERLRLVPELVAALEGMLKWARRVKQLNPGPEISVAHNVVTKAKRVQSCA